MKKPSSRREKTFKNSPPSYFHPQDLGFYYLKSRYYDPNICRFINADGLASTGQGFLGCNMFAYCNNNPVSGTDPNGNTEMDATRPWVVAEGVAGLYVVPWRSDDEYGFGDYLYIFLVQLRLIFQVLLAYALCLKEQFLLL